MELDRFIEIALRKSLERITEIDKGAHLGFYDPQGDFVAIAHSDGKGGMELTIAHGVFVVREEAED